MKKIHLLYLLPLFLFVNKAFSQVAINNTGSPAEESAMLDISAPDKGLLVPRVALVSTINNAVPINNPATGLLVYNIDETNLSTGFYLWNGNSWSSLATMDQVQNVIQGPASAGVYGEVYDYNEIGDYAEIPIPNEGEYVTWNTGTQGDISGMSFDNGLLSVLNPGMYSVSYNAVIQIASGGKIVDAAFFVNGLRQDDMHGRVWFKEGGKSQDISFSGLIYLDENDEIYIAFTMNASSEVRLETANLNITRIN